MSSPSNGRGRSSITTGTCLSTVQPCTGPNILITSVTAPGMMALIYPHFTDQSLKRPSVCFGLPSKQALRLQLNPCSSAPSLACQRQLPLDPHAFGRMGIPLFQTAAVAERECLKRASLCPNYLRQGKHLCGESNEINSKVEQLHTLIDVN